MADVMSPQLAFRQHEFLPPQQTISLSEASLQTPSCSQSRSSTPMIKDEPGDEKKPTKKRKSWGQELPTPKTNLPPRKRAKTDDEKEQRRIERVLRNRAAAQSSRERKRQEVEKLEGEKATIELQNQYLKDRLLAVEHDKFLLNQKVAKMSAEITSLKSGSSSPSDGASPAPESATFDHVKIKQEIDDTIVSFSTPPLFSSPSTMTYSPSQSPSQPSLSFDDESLVTSPDMTQHPAAMLCDLQCQSLEVPHQATSPQHTAAATATPSSSASMSPIISMILASTVYSQLMTPLYQIFSNPTLRATITSMSARRTSRSVVGRTSASMIPTSLLTRWLISTLSNRTTTTNQSFTSNLATTERKQASPTRKLRMLHGLFLSSPPLARPLKDATGRTLRGQTSNMKSRRRHLVSRPDCDSGAGKCSSGQSWLAGSSVRSSRRGGIYLHQNRSPTYSRMRWR